jgi:hypothetical protein
VRSANRIEAISSSGRVSSLRYTVPEFRVKVRLSFTNTGEKVTGVLFWKRTEGAGSEVPNEIEMNIVAVPRSGSG